MLLWTSLRAGADEDRPATHPKPEGEAPASAAATSAPDDGRVNLFLGGPGALDALLKALERPDFVLLKGDAYRKLLERAAVAEGVKEQAAVVDSVAVEGTILADRADLSIEFGITLRSSGPSWVPIRLDDLTVTGASEGARERRLQVVGGGWQVELQGAGVHRVRVALKVPLRATVEGHRIDFAIPEAASTRFAWEVADRVTDASTGNGEIVEVEPVTGSGGARTRLSAQLTPRARLDVGWRTEAESGVQLPPLLTLQGDIAIDIDPGSFRTRSTWAVHAVRGTTRSLELRLDPADEVLDLELDGQTVPAGIERVDGATLLTVVLNEPLRPGVPKSLVMTTRRPISTATAASITFGGFPLLNAQEQSGAIGIAQSGNLWIGGTAGRGLRRIDPRIELTPDLRARPATSLAYIFADQPFELALRIAPSPPLVRTEARTTATLDARQARVETWLDYQIAHGRLFDVAIGLPEGLELESVGPDEVVEASQRDQAPAGSAGARALSGGEGASRVLTVRLTPQAQEGGAFTLHLTGRQALDPAHPVNLALFQPLDATSGGGRVAVLTDRNVTADVRDDDGSTGVFRRAPQETPADWPWPAERPTGNPAALWLRHDGRPSTLPLAVTVHPRTVSSRTSLRVQVERRWLVVEQETECTVHFGTLSSVDVNVPAPLKGRWEVEGSEVSNRTELGSTPGGDQLTRLVLAKDVRDKVHLRFRIRSPLPSAPEPDRPITLEVPWVRMIEGESLPLQVQVASEPGIDLEPIAEGWARSSSEEGTGPGASDLPVRFVLASTGVSPQPATLRLVAQARPLTPLPPLVASRLWLRTVQGPEHDTRTTAVYLLETHDSTLSVALPPDAEWVRAKVGGKTVSQVELLPKASGYRLSFPERIEDGPVTVELEYTVPAASASGRWIAPRLLDGGLVEQTLWEIQVPSGRAVVGVPPGWNDENTWVWDGLFFHRRPRRGTAMLAAWANGTPSPEERPETALEADGPYDTAAGVGQSYLFGQNGQPTDLRLWIATRGLLVGVCSGTVLALGALLILNRRPSLRLACGAMTVLGLTVAAIVQPSATFLAVQSAMVGVLLTLLTAAMERLVHGRRRPAPLFGESSGLTGPVPPGSTVSRTIGVGSDDSTAIRARPNSTTVDHYVPGTPAVPGPEETSGRSLRAD